ncbi:MAG TPA: 3'-5' exonuclease, partial [Acidimicrobiales bacterium]|nr:3'-5' exonuclease [Acidimicrobiales bacterium]
QSALPGGLPATLRRLADEHALEDPGSSVGAFLAWWGATAGETDRAEDEGREDGGGTDAVELSTFHRAKGLEWAGVALVGLEDGLVPISYATSDAAQAEERRLLYVAVTRAEEELWCSWAARRQLEQRSWRCDPSPLLAGIEATAVETDPVGRRRFDTVRIASLRAQLSAAG